MREGVFCIIQNDKKEILFQKKTLDYKVFPGKWSLFGGRAESKNIEKEMKRELKEEINCRLKLKFLFNHKDDSDNELYYIFGSCLNDLKKIRVGEGAGIAFFGKKELENLDLIPVIREIVIKYLSNKSLEKSV